MAERRCCLCAIHGFFLPLLLPFFFSFSVLDVPLAAAALSKKQDAIMRDIASLVNSESSWSTGDSDPCFWSGISCSSSGSSVVGITLSNYGISNSSIFAPLCRLDSLQILDLSRNYLTDLTTQFFSPSCSMKEGLRFLNLSNNQISRPLSNLSGFPLLLVLDLSFNSFTSGNLSADLGSFPNLKSLNISSNNLDGDVPTSMVGPLAELVLSGNQLSGSIPWSLFKYENLTLLDLSQNQLTGGVPNAFKSLSKLETLLLSGNALTGKIPESLLNVTTLSRFAAKQNNFIGTIPSNITSHVQMLDLSYNSLSGKIPTDFFSHMGLQTVDLTSNMLEGPIPSHLSGSLYCLRLGGNRLSGNISHSICDRMGLTYLELDDNQLTGNIPSELSKCKALSFLSVASNNLQGPVPAALSSLEKLVVLKLQNNSLTGPIPPYTFPDLRSLTTMNLNYNYLSGSIPSDLGYLNELQILDLSHNILSGEVPSSLGSLESLTQLVLSYNNLSGSVPRFGQNVEVYIIGNPGLVNGTGKNNDAPATSKRKAHDVVVIIFVAASALVGLCLLLVIAKISFPKRKYRAENEMVPTAEGDSEISNGCLIEMNCICICTSTTMFMREKRDDWRITSFQTLNFEAAHILQRLTWENLVGSGGSGHVYRVTYTNQYNNSAGVVAVKQIQSGGTLDEKLEHEFESEVSILCNIRHNNIVKLLCCLSSAESKLLVYDYMDNGSLDRWLHGDYILRAEHAMARARPVQRVPLDWPTRLIAAVGAAQGLCYMHHNCSPPIIHRDVKTSNILLDSEFRAKVADFGLARMLVQTGEPNTMTWVVGSFGYMAPEYAYTRKVTEKVDVFGFGVVLLELTTGKKATDGGDHGSLAEWAAHHYQSGASIPDATDICIRYSGYTDEIDTLFRLGVKCTGNSPSSRPTMEDVLQILLKCSEQTLRKSRLEYSVG
ncbi:hypothetical protein BS78_08G053400 [Paspalum vaginatum]|nr:hypothetical protein BS78_08G053400 [Paspalum vaginatum]